MVLTNEDLLKEVSTRELQELSDFEGSGAVNQSVIDDSAPRLGIRAFRHSEKKMDLKDLNG